VCFPSPLELVLAVSELYWPTQFRLFLEQVYLKGVPVAAGSRTPNAFGLHGGVVKTGRPVWARELRYLDAHIGASAGSWGGIFKLDAEDAKRANISDDPGVPNTSVDMDIEVEKRDENRPLVTPPELAELKRVVKEWMEARQDDVSVVDDDDVADAGGGGDGGDRGDGGADGSGSGCGSGSGGENGSGGGDEQDGGVVENAGGGADENAGPAGDGGRGRAGLAGRVGSGRRGEKVRRAGKQENPSQKVQPSQTEAELTALFGPPRLRHPLSPTTSQEEAVVRRPSWRRWKVPHRQPDRRETSSTGGSTTDSSDHDFIVPDSG